MARRAKVKRPKAVKVQPIDRETAGELNENYRLMETLVKNHHERLRGAKICLAWALGWKPDRDGFMKLGAAKKAADLDRQLHAYDFVILLNSGAWHSFEIKQKMALLDHELCHCQVVHEDGSPKRDEQGRIVYRIRKHDVEEFTEILARHGCWKKDLEAFAHMAMERYKTPLYDGPHVNGEANGHAPRPMNAAARKKAEKAAGKGGAA